VFKFSTNTEKKGVRDERIIIIKRKKKVVRKIIKRKKMLMEGKVMVKDYYYRL
jgi:hypothetical protein